MRFKLLLLCSSLLFSQGYVEVKEHVVKEGESLSLIAEKYNKDWSEIYYFNSDSIGIDANMIKPDKTIQIPLNSYYEVPSVPSYHWEFSILLVLLAIFIFVYYRKQFSVPNAPQTVVVESKPQIIEKSSEVSIDSVSNKKKTTSEVSIEENKMGGSWKHSTASNIELPSEKLESNIDQKKLKEKLKKIRG